MSNTNTAKKIIYRHWDWLDIGNNREEANKVFDVMTAKEYLDFMNDEEMYALVEKWYIEYNHEERLEDLGAHQFFGYVSNDWGLVKRLEEFKKDKNY